MNRAFTQGSPLESQTETNPHTSSSSSNLALITIQDWLLLQASQLMSIEAQAIDPTTSLEHYGLDSVAAIGLVAELSEYIGYELPPELLLEYPSIQALAQYCDEIEETVL